MITQTFKHSISMLQIAQMYIKQLLATLSIVYGSLRLPFEYIYSAHFNPKIVFSIGNGNCCVSVRKAF